MNLISNRRAFITSSGSLTLSAAAVTLLAGCQSGPGIVVFRLSLR